jgi:hypothetical protein
VPEFPCEKNDRHHLHDDFCASWKCGGALLNLEKGSIMSKKNWWIMTLLMCPPFGPLGAYVYYTQGAKAGFIRTITLSGLTILYFIDCFKWMAGNLTDGEGQKIQFSSKD